MGVWRRNNQANGARVGGATKNEKQTGGHRRWAAASAAAIGKLGGRKWRRQAGIRRAKANISIWRNGGQRLSIIGGESVRRRAGIGGRYQNRWRWRASRRQHQAS
jgi:hypothetical protein